MGHNLFFVTVCLAINAWAVAADPASPDEIAAAVAQLGNDSISNREKATEFLWQSGSASIPALEKAVQSGDREVATRARLILEKVRLGITPDTPPEKVEQIRKYHDSDLATKEQLLQELIEKQQLETVAQLLAGDPEDEAKALKNQLTQVAHQRASENLSKRQFEEAEKALRNAAILNVSASAVRRYAMFLLGRGVADETLKKLQTSAKSGSKSDSELCARLVRMIPDLGDAAPAAPAASAANEVESPNGDAALDPRQRQLDVQLRQLIRDAAENSIIEQTYHSAQRLLARAARCDRSLAGVRNYAALLLVRGKLNETIAQLKDAGQHKTDPWEATILSVLLQVAGNLKEARQLAELTDNRDLKRDLYYRLEDWTALASPDLRPAELSQQVIVLGLAGAPDLEASILAIKQQAPDQVRATRMARVLMFHDRWTEAFDLMGARDGDDAVDLFIFQRRYIEAFRRLGIDDIHTDLAAWSANQFLGLDIPPAQSPEKRGTGQIDQLDLKWNRPFQRVLAVATQVYSLGELDLARQLFAALEKTPPDYQQNRHTMLLAAEYKPGLRDDSMKLFVSLMDEGNYSAPNVLRGIFPNGMKVAGFWWECFRTWSPQDDAIVRLQKVRSVLRSDTTGYLPADWTLAEMMEQAEKVASQMSEAERLDGLHSIAETCVQKGNSPLARKYFESAAALAVTIAREKQAASQTDDSAAISATARSQLATAATRVQMELTRIGDVFAKDKQWSQAAEAYRRAWQAGKHNPLPLFMQGFAIGKSGEADAGRELMEQAALLPLADSARRDRFASDLEFRGLKSQALQQWEAILQLGACENFNDFNLNHALEAVGRSARESDPARAAALYLRFCMVLCQPNVAVSIGDFARTLHHAHSLRALSLMKADDWEQSIREAHLAQNVSATDSEFVEQAVELLDKSGRKEEADRLFQTSYDAFAGVLRDFPASADNHNGLAWLAARCNRRLDDAHRHAEQALHLVPDRAQYLDTMAEVYFRQGDRGRAIELERQAIDKSPADVRLQRQLERFQTKE